MYSRLLVASRAPEDGPWTDLFQGPWMAHVGIHWCAGAACGAGVCCVLIEISTPCWQSTPPLLKTPNWPISHSFWAPGERQWVTVGGGQGLNLSSVPPLSSSEALAAFQTLGPSVSSVKIQMLTPSWVDRIQWNVVPGSILLMLVCPFLWEKKNPLSDYQTDTWEQNPRHWLMWFLSLGSLHIYTCKLVYNTHTHTHTHTHVWVLF